MLIMNAANNCVASRPQRHVPSINTSHCKTASRLCTYCTWRRLPDGMEPRAYQHTPYISSNWNLRPTFCR